YPCPAREFHWWHKNIALFSLTIYAPASMLLSTNCAKCRSQSSTASRIASDRSHWPRRIQCTIGSRSAIVLKNTFLNSRSLRQCSDCFFWPNYAPNRASQLGLATGEHVLRRSRVRSNQAQTPQPAVYGLAAATGIVAPSIH